MGKQRPVVGAPTSDASLVSVRFARAHTHAGIQHQPGDVLHGVDAGDAQLMRDFHVLDATLYDPPIRLAGVATSATATDDVTDTMDAASPHYDGA